MCPGAEQLEFVRLQPRFEQALVQFFAALVEGHDDWHFHPHPFTPEAASERVRYQGRDVYCVAVSGSRVLGYGMLRGWDEGYEVPSLGIAIHPDARGIGLGRAMMLYLHAEARRRGASRIRLKVHPENARAVDLYRSLGYEFGVMDQGQLVGFKTVTGRP
jgi:ribosomal protein S18 acetylase RimI-like enzyme